MLEYGYALAMVDLKTADINKYNNIVKQIQVEYRKNVSIICISKRIHQDPNSYYSVIGLEDVKTRLYHLQYKLATHFFHSSKENPIWKYMPRPERIAPNDTLTDSSQLIRKAPLFGINSSTGMRIGPMLEGWIDELVKTCPKSMANYTGCTKIPNTYPEDKFIHYEWPCCNPCLGHKLNFQYYDVKEYDINTNEIPTGYDPNYISNNISNYNHNNHLRSKTLLSWHPLKPLRLNQRKKKSNSHSANTTITTHFPTLNHPNSSILSTTTTNSEHYSSNVSISSLNQCVRIPPFARSFSLAVRNIKFCDKDAIYKAFMYRANANPFRFNCFIDHTSSNRDDTHYNTSQRIFRQNHLNKCVLPWISENYPEMLHPKLKSIESILNHNLMELFHIIVAIAMTLCLKLTDDRINDVFIALLRKVFMLDILHKISSIVPLKPILDHPKYKIIGLLDIDKFFNKDHITEIINAFKEYTLQAMIIFIPVEKINLLEDLPNLHIIFTTKEDHNFFKEKNNTGPNSIGSTVNEPYALVLSCLSDKVLQNNFYFKFPTLLYTINRIGSIDTIHDTILDANKRHSSKTIGLTDDD